MRYTTFDECLEKSNALIAEAKALVAAPDASAEDLEKAKRIFEDAKQLRERSKMLQELDTMAGEAKQQPPQAPKRQPEREFGSFGKMLQAVHTATFGKERDPRLVYKTFDGEPEYKAATGWVEAQKDLVENTGSSGGFLVPPEYVNNMMLMTDLTKYVRSRAMVIRMARRQVNIPVLDQTGTTSGVSNYYGGIIPKWTEEAAEKDESEPKFRQLTLVAHKLILYTEVSDELLADSAVALESFLTQHYGSTIANEEEYTFINGTGAGQPLGIINAGATITVARAGAGAIAIDDIFNMVSQFQGQSPIWLAHQSTMPQILGLNGPAGNASYVWIGNGRDQMPTTLMGYPIYFVENAQTLGTAGDLILADWSKYIIGDRQGLTIDSSKHYRFQYDLTSWRAVHRVDGRPWLSAHITYRDGTTQVSPFVILGDAAGT